MEYRPRRGNITYNSAPAGGSFGSSSAAVIFAGSGATTGTSYAANQDHADKWNGTAVSATASLTDGSINYHDTHGAGSQEAGLGFGGWTGSGTTSNVVTYTYGDK